MTGIITDESQFGFLSVAHIFAQTLLPKQYNLTMSQRVKEPTQNFRHQTFQPPLEIVDRILIVLAETTGAPRLAFRCASYFGRFYVQVEIVQLAISVDEASELGLTHVANLHVSKESRRHSFTSSAMELARKDGHLNVLRWWRASNLKMQYSPDAIDYASKDGHVAVLEWRKSSELDLLYSSRANGRAWATGVVAIDNASSTGNLDILKCQTGRVDVLDWWGSSGLDLVWDERAVDEASRKGHVAVLDWWKAIAIEMRWTRRVMDAASWENHVAVLGWWKSSGLSLQYSISTIDNACSNGHNYFLDWWRSSDLSLVEYSSYTIDNACSNGHISVLDWWKSSGLTKKRTTKSIDQASSSHTSAKVHKSGLQNARKARSLVVLEWWKSSGLALMYDEGVMDTASEHGRAEVLEWWRTTLKAMDLACVQMDILQHWSGGSKADRRLNGMMEDPDWVDDDINFDEEDADL
ncbi:hypothetical protein BJ742DRAFT_867857 [Cladochytrium replicatum]|nr:hypothetical protein BJ742DRAFT_867857 [Cladochytrium replicatum]